MTSYGNAVAIKSAKGKHETIFSCPGICRTALDAFAAIDALFKIKVHGLCLLIHMDGFFRADRFTNTAITAGRRFPGRQSPPFDPEIIFFSLQTIIVTARKTEFEFMRQFTSPIAAIEIIRQMHRINKPGSTDRISLTGRNRAHARPAYTDLNTTSQQCLFDFFNILQLNEGNLDALTRCQMDIALAKLLSNLLDCPELLRSKMTPHRFQTHGKVVLLLLAHKAAFF